MYKHIFFDLDGTLTDSKLGITKAIQYALNKEGIEEIDLSKLEKLVGPPLNETFSKDFNFDEITTERAINNFREYFSDTGIYENNLYAGVLELLNDLKEKGYTISIATSKPTVYAERIINHFHIEKYFHKIVGSNLDGTRNSKAEVIEYLLKEIGMNGNEDIVMIGDRKHDIEGANLNNLNCIGVLYGYGSLEELQQLNPTYIVESIEELYDKLA
ncbi:HAD family hydrolase [Clostridium grantii]|uniref:Phosphoglycolate phosphatase n=1 Tax=Clostridium grantii DSM 8605 TaxID=1121316 RepID=A0A1M5X6Q6_9CLOT|nr:HAD family hydrolase [Clostridium grantii]SHH94903.1 phosphoglycolate phosphatase [Clostridium grantii DSM 8605]